MYINTYTHIANHIYFKICMKHMYICIANDAPHMCGGYDV